MKRWISLLCAVGLLLGCMALPARAAELGAMGPVYSEISGKRDFVWPVPGCNNLQSCFYDNGGNRTRDHNAIDIAAAIGTPVVAVYGGKVLEVSEDASNGKYIKLEHSYVNRNGEVVTLQTMYLHLDSQSVSRGQSVSAGQRIGKSGNTGDSEGPHLHLHVYWNGKAIDPYSNQLMPESNINNIVVYDSWACGPIYWKKVKALYAEELTPPSHTCDKGEYKWDWTAHPHYSCYECSICGEVWHDTSSGKYVSGCDTCGEPEIWGEDIFCPSALLAGQDCNPTGVLKANNGIKWVWVGIYSGSEVVQSVTEDVWRTGIPNSYIIDDLAAGLDFSILSDGEYELSIQGMDRDNNYFNIWAKEFSVGPPEIWAEGVTYPTSLNRGDDFEMTGTLFGNNGIKWVWIGIYSGNDMIQSMSEDVWRTGIPNSYTLDGLASGLTFSSLSAGKYRISIQCMDRDNNYFNIPEQEFWVYGLVDVLFDANGGTLPLDDAACFINGFNRDRGGNELIVFDVPGTKVTTNTYGHEVAVNGDGLVTQYRDYGNTTQLVVPADGFVVSGQGTSSTSEAARFVIAADVGDYIAYDVASCTAFLYKSKNNYLCWHKKAEPGASYGTLPEITREGYTFDGWYTEPEGGTKVTEDTIVTADSSHTLYAHWTKETYTITYKGNILGGGSNVPASQTKEQGNGIFLREQIPSGELRADFIFNDGERGVHQSVPATFKEWNTKADGTGECYMPGDTYVADESVTLYAQWEATVDLLEDPVWEGHRFDGWFYEPMYGEGTRLNGPQTITKNTEIFAHWTEVEEPPAPVEPDENTAVFQVSSVQGRPGQTVEVTVSLENNPGLIAASMALSYDKDKLTLVEAVDTELLADGVFSKPLDTNPFHMRWEDSLADGDNTASGPIATLKFQISEDCPEGEIPLTLTLSPTEIYNYDVEIVASASESGSIQVVQYVPGDGNGDGTADSRDVTILRRYLAHWPNITIDLPAMDVNADGASDSRDVTVMRRYLAHWPGYSLGGQTLPVSYSVQGEEAPKGTDPLKLTVSDVSGLPGEEVEVTITMENNPGVVAACLDLAYDESKLELVKVADGGILNDPTFSKTTETNPYALRWEDSLAEENNGKNGVIATLTFRILETCEPGTIPLTLTFRPGEIYDVDLNPVPTQAVNGTVTVEEEPLASYDAKTGAVTLYALPEEAQTAYIAAYANGQLLDTITGTVGSGNRLTLDRPADTIKVIWLDKNYCPVAEACEINVD